MAPPLSAACRRTPPPKALFVRSWRSLACVCAWLLLASTALAELPEARVGPGTRTLDLLPHLAVLEDPDHGLELRDVLRPGANQGFEPLGTRTASFGYTHSAWWLHAAISNDTGQSTDIVLRQSYVLLDHFDVYLVDDGRLLQQWTTGDTLPYSTRPIPHRDYLFPVTMAPGQSLDVYLRARSEGPVNVALSLYTPEALVPTLGAEQLAMGALFGSFALLALCTALLYGFVRDEAFAYYLFYVLCYGAYMAVFNGIAQQYLWPESPALWGVGQVVLLMLALHFLLHFSRSLLRAKGQSRWLDRIFLGLQVVIFALMLAAPFFDYGSLVKPITLIVAFTVFMVVAIGITGLRARQAAAGYFLLAWSVFLVGVLLYLAKSVGLLPHTWLTQYGFQVGTIFEFVLLSVALGLRVKEIRKQSRTDSLTGLANRSRYDELIEQAFAHSRAAGTTLGLLVIDVDHFKGINDSHGHAFGDRILEAVAASLRRHLPPSAVACRYGGEEFVVLVPRTDSRALAALAERLRLAVAASSPVVPVTASIGIASTGEHAFADPRGLFRAADEALYAAKRTGRDRVVVWDTELPRHPAAPLAAVP